MLTFLSSALIYVTYAGKAESTQTTDKKYPINVNGEPFTEHAPENYRLDGIGEIYAQTNPSALYTN